MSDRDTNNEPLFQNMDEQERIYAPQQVPGEQIVAEERDRGSDAGESAAADEGSPCSGHRRGTRCGRHHRLDRWLWPVRSAHQWCRSFRFAMSWTPTKTAKRRARISEGGKRVRG